jgi:hypothetical protein
MKMQGKGGYSPPQGGKSHNAVVGDRHDPRSAKGAKTGGMKGAKC